MNRLIEPWRKPSVKRVGKGLTYFSRALLECVKFKKFFIRHIRPKIPSRMPVSSCTTERPSRNDWINTSRSASRKRNALPRNGNGLAARIAQNQWHHHCPKIDSDRGNSLTNSRNKLGE